MLFNSIQYLLEHQKIVKYNMIFKTSTESARSLIQCVYSKLLTSFFYDHLKLNDELLKFKLHFTINSMWNFRISSYEFYLHQKMLDEELFKFQIQKRIPRLQISLKQIN